MSSYGYMSMYKPPKPPSLASAASAKDPYGLAPNNRSGPLGVGSSSGFAAPAAAPKTPDYSKQFAASNAANPQAAGANGSLFAYQGQGGPIQQMPPTAMGVNHYDINTDPALQQITALLGQSDDQAQASALKQRQNLLLAYGDPTVASSVLGDTDPIVKAASGNPTSTVAQLNQSRDRNLKTLDDQLNDQNLAYSGYRVTQEQQAGQDYQNALAQAAAGLNTNLDTVGSNLSQALGANNMQRASALSDAANRHAGDTTDPGAGLDLGSLVAAATGGGDTTPLPSGNGGTSTDPMSGASYADPLASALQSAAFQKLLRQGLPNDDGSSMFPWAVINN